jgi:hypothetical protein
MRLRIQCEDVSDARTVIRYDGNARRRMPPCIRRISVASAIPSTIPRVPDLSLESPILLPPVVRCTHFVNLTNGLEAVPHLTALGIDYQLVR